MATIEEFIQLANSVVKQGNQEHEAQIRELLHDLNTLPILFSIIREVPDVSLRLFAIICLKERLFSKNYEEEEIPEELMDQLKQFLIEKIDSESELVVTNNLCYVAGNLLTEKHQNWPEILQFDFALLENPEKLDKAFALSNSIKLIASPENSICSQEDQIKLAQFAIENLQNTNYNVRFQAAFLIEAAVDYFDKLEIDKNNFQEVLLACFQRVFYETEPTEDSFLEAHQLCICVIEAFTCSNPFLSEGPLLEFFIQAIQDDQLLYKYRYEAGSVVGELTSRYLEEYPDDLANFLNIATEFTAYLASEDYTNGEFEVLYFFIYNIAFTFDDNTPLEFVKEKVNELCQSEDIPDEYRIVGLFLIDAVVPGSREYIYPSLPTIAQYINILGTTDNDYIINYTCRLYEDIIESLPESIHTIVNYIFEYLTNYMGQEGTFSCFIKLLSKSLIPPTGLDDFLNQLLEAIPEIDDEDALKDQIILISACLECSKTIREELFQQLGPFLFQIIQENDVVVPCSLYLFAKLARVSPQSTIDNIEEIIPLSITAFETESLTQIKNALILLDTLITHLPITIEGFLDNIIPAVWAVKEAYQIKTQLPDSAEHIDENIKEELHAMQGQYLHIIGHLVACFPARMQELVQEIIELFKYSIDPYSDVSVAACESFSWAMEGFYLMGGEEIPSLITQTVATLPNYLEKEGARDRIAAFYLLAQAFIKTFPEQLNTPLGQTFAKRIPCGLDGELADYLPFELSVNLDTSIVISYFPMIITLLSTQFDNYPIIAESFKKTANSHLDSYHHYICAFCHQALSQIIYTTGDTGDAYRQCFENALKLPHVPFPQPCFFESYYAILLNLMLTDFELFCQCYMNLLQTDIDTLLANFVKSFDEQPSNLTFILLAVSIYSLRYTDIPPNTIQKLADRVLVPPNIKLIYVISNFIVFGNEQWPDVFNARLPAFATRALASTDYYIRRIPQEILSIFVQQAQQLDENTVYSYLQNDQTLFLRFARNLERFAAALSQ